MRAIIFTMLLAGVYAAVPEEVPALDGTVYAGVQNGARRVDYQVHGCTGGSSVATSSSSAIMSSSSYASSSFVIDCVGGCLTAAPNNGGIGNCPDMLTFGQSCVPTCNSGYTLSANHTCAAATGNVLQAATCTAPSASSSNATASSATVSTATSTVTQIYTFASLAAGDYSGSVKGNIQCAYANTVEGGTTWCVAASGPAWTYKSTVSITSTAAARRSAKVTFVLVVATSEKTLDQIKTLVASNSNPANFATALTAVNTASNFTASPGAATVATATFTSSGSGASSLMPSMLALVSALFIAFKHM